MKKLKLFTNLNLKLSTGIVPLKREFHPLIVRGKKEKELKKILFFALGTRTLKVFRNVA